MYYLQILCPLTKRTGFASGWIKTAGLKEVKDIMRQRRLKVIELIASGHFDEAFKIVGLMKKHIFQIPFTAYSSENEKREFLR